MFRVLFTIAVFIAMLNCNRHKNQMHHIESCSTRIDRMQSRLKLADTGKKIALPRQGSSKWARDSINRIRSTRNLSKKATLTAKFAQKTVEPCDPLIKLFENSKNVQSAETWEQLQHDTVKAITTCGCENVDVDSIEYLLLLTKP